MDKNIFKQDAKIIVDLAFDSNLFKDSVTRDNMKTFEELIDYMLSSRFESYKKTEKLLKDLRRIKSK